LVESASFEVYFVKIRPPVFTVGDDKRKGNERKGKVHKVTRGSYLNYMGSRPPCPISTKKLKGLYGTTT